MEQRGGPPGKVLKTLPAGQAAALTREVAEALRTPHRPVLVVLSGPQVGLRRSTVGGLVIGRDPTCGLVLDDPLVSGHHARLEDRGDGWALIDLGSTNGTLVNGRRGVEFVLAPNDKLIVGRSVLRFEMHNSLEQAYDDLVERLLNIDDLSGLFVRRKFDADLTSALEGVKACGEPFGLLVMDLDGVKAINDAHGHLFGAHVIGEAGHLIGRVIGGRGFGSRFGGDEYCAALPGMDITAAEAVGEEIRSAVARYEFVREGVRLAPGISVGVASAPESASTAEALFEAADQALYRAKRGGKNRVCR